MEFLCGAVTHQLDGKNRIRIPAKFRALLGEKCYFAILPNCIGVYPEETILRVVESLRDIKTGDPRYEAKVDFMASINEVTEDDQGRTVLSADYRDYAGIKKDVVSIGMDTYLQIWAKERRDERTEGHMMKSSPAILNF